MKPKYEEVIVSLRSGTKLIFKDVVKITQSLTSIKIETLDKDVIIALYMATILEATKLPSIRKSKNG